MKTEAIEHVISAYSETGVTVTPRVARAQLAALKSHIAELETENAQLREKLACKEQDE